ncbi:SCO3374 family protein [Streptomyces sp. NA04227]|uniref:SCO3374 family protein n=1 Tax=Streptomyces sp. NA04227 TaxID=2742136 RepID=UPI0020CA8FA9|nr:SCO3374 family protein [Streptomyces sp. NA04227]
MPRPRRAPESTAGAPGHCPARAQRLPGPGHRDPHNWDPARLRAWYVDGLGWGELYTAGPVARLRTGIRFDVLEMPAEAGLALLRELGPECVAALGGGTVRLLVSAGGAQELPGLLDWLQWGALVPELRALGTGGHIDAPLPPGPPGVPVLPVPGAGAGSQGAAVWLRPPELGGEVETALPGPVAVGDGRGAPSLSLVRLVDAAASYCLRVRMRRVAAQPLAFS